MQEVEGLNKSLKQAAAGHSSTEVRLNRALEEVEKLKTQIDRMKHTNVVSTRAALNGLND